MLATTNRFPYACREADGGPSASRVCMAQLSGSTEIDRLSRMVQEATPGEHPTLPQLARFFLQLGTLAFGGPAAHIAIMEDQLVTRKKWLSREDFLDLLGAANLLPGPSSTELTIYIGYRLNGFPGLLIAGICFILPAALIVAALAWAYLRYGALPATAAILYGVKPVIIALIIQALWRLGRTAVKTRFLGLIALICVALALVPLNPVIILCVGGLLSAVGAQAANSDTASALPALAAPAFGVATLSASQIAIGSIFGAFLKIGCVVFGSGYVLLAFLQHDLVDQRHWLSPGQLLDAVAVGQVTPGPVFTTATFIGYLLAGPRGAAAATVAIFLPAFVVVAATGRFIPRIRKSWYAGAFLDGLNVASLALMLVVLRQLAITAVTDPLTIAIAVVSAAVLLTTKLNSFWLIATAAVIGLLRTWG
jgi:chromate transporter